MEELKPTKQEEAEMVVVMLNSDGWKIIDHWLKENLEASRSALEESKDDTRYWQGQIAVYKQIFNKVKGYNDAITSRKE